MNGQGMYRQRLTPKYMDKAWKDTDKDGVINMGDCRPHNRRKQGFFGHVVRKVGSNISQTYKDYRDKAPERETARIESLKRQADAEEQKVRLEEARAKARKARSLS